MEEADEQRALERARGGDRQAFAVLVDRYWGRVFRWLAGLTRQPALAEDLTQEVFLKAWQHLPSFQAGARGWRAWLFTIARRCLCDDRRVSRPAGPHALPEELLSPEAGPEQTALEREGATLLELACRRLPATFRAAFVLWSQEQLSFAEIAEVLDLTEATARWRVFKARLLLVEALGAYLDRKKP
jgi:RNA polymerase sigma-70 factor (ECF subfamily)